MLPHSPGTFVGEDGTRYPRYSTGYRHEYLYLSLQEVRGTVTQDQIWDELADRFRGWVGNSVQPFVRGLQPDYKFVRRCLKILTYSVTKTHPKTVVCHSSTASEGRVKVKLYCWIGSLYTSRLYPEVLVPNTLYGSFDPCLAILSTYVEYIYVIFFIEAYGNLISTYNFIYNSTLRSLVWLLFLSKGVWASFGGDS